MAKIREELILYDKFTQTFTRYIQLGERAAGAANTAQRATEQFERSQRTASAATDVMTGSLRRLVSGYLGLRGIQGILNLSDTLASTTARLDMMNDGLQTTAELNEMIFESAQRARGAYADTAAFVAKLGTLAGNAFSSSAEIVAFAEQINKQMVLSGTSATEAQGAMLQLTQALSSGVLRGEELNSVLEQTPMIAQTIADYLGVTTGEMRELASEGAITAEVVKNAMFAAAEETNAKFEEMPRTWGQVWTQIQNIALRAFEPILDAVGELADWIGDNIDVAIAAFYGLAAAVAVYTAAQWIATGAAKAFFTSLVQNPVLLAVAAGIGIVVAAIYLWIQAAGGLQIAWLKVSNFFQVLWDGIKILFFTGVYYVMDLWDKLNLKVMAISFAIQDWIGEMKVNVLQVLQDMVNGAVDIINAFINAVNKIPFVSIATIDKVTFATTAAVEEEAAKEARAEELAAATATVESSIADRQAELDDMIAQADANAAAREAEIAALQAENDAVAAAQPEVPTAGQMEDLMESVGGIEKSVSATDEDLRSLVDLAERRYVNQINLTAQTPVINVTGQNTGNTAADRRNLANALRDILLEQRASGSTISTAQPAYG